MSSTPAMDPTQTAPSGKKKNSKKKKNANKPKETLQVGNGATREDGDVSDEPETPVQNTYEGPSAIESSTKPSSDANGHVPSPTTNGHPGRDKSVAVERADIPFRDREDLQAEVEKLRKQLEDKDASEETTSRFKTELEEATAAKEEAEEKYQSLLERVEKIKSVMSDRLQRDREELEGTKERVEELETQNEALRKGVTTSNGEIAKLKTELQEASRDLTSLRSRNNLSAQNWMKEKEELTRQNQHLREELESTTTAMGEWEVIAMEERSKKESLGETVGELEEQLASTTDAYNGLLSERDSQSRAIDNLQKALQEIQEARKKELREMVESSEEQLQALKKLVQGADARATEAEGAKAALSRELERTAPFEKEVKEKNLLIGKLRHEAIVLNDHLTKALRYLKKTKPEDNVDRQIVTNHLLHFLTLDRSDPKRFQILQVMAGYLNWTDEQREQAGLARPGTSGTSLRLPSLPFHRTPSTPSLNTEFLADATPTGKESLAELWAGFLERSAEEGTGGEPSRKDSASSAGTGVAGLARPESRA